MNKGQPKPKKESKSDLDETIKNLNTKFDIMLGLLTMNIEKSVNGQIQLLHSLGLERPYIAKILGKSKGHVDKTIGELKKKSKKK